MKYIKIFELYNNRYVGNSLSENFIYEHIKILKELIKILKKYLSSNKNIENNGYKFAIKFFTLIHNFLILQIGFDDYLQNKDDINVTLIPHLKNTHFLKLKTKYKAFDIVYSMFEKMYDPSHLTRNMVERFDRIEIIKEYLKNKPYIYNKLLNINKTLEEIEDFKIKKIAKNYNL